MSDFASATMLRVLLAGMRRLGLDSSALQADLPELTGHGGPARVGLDLKRELVSHACQQGGMACLPLLGRGIHDLPPEPTHATLLSARSPAELVERWMRLERYIHSRHRCRLLRTTPLSLRLQHESLTDSPPLAVEDLVVLGVLAALLETTGCEGLQVTLGRTPVWPEVDADGLRRAIQRRRTGVWTFFWLRHVPAVAVAQRIAGDGRRSQAGVPRDLPELPVNPQWSTVAKSLWQLLTTAPAATPSLQSCAEQMRMAPRTLQRELQAAGLSWSALLAEARLQSAAWRLLNTPLSIAEVGYLSGFADQAHMTRQLRNRVGMTPARYRAEFAVVPALP